MATDLKQLPTQLLDQGRKLWENLPPRRRWVLIASVAGVLSLGLFLALRPASEEWTVLSAGGATDDTARIVEHLKVQNVRYRLGNNNTIEVPASQLHDARLGLALNDMAVGGGSGFELFDKQGFGRTSFDEAVTYQRALQGELERTLRLLDSVQKARVLIARPERSLYTQDDRQPSASVTLTLKRRLTPSQIKGIINVVASSVEGLTPDRVTLVDGSGAVLSSGGGDESGTETQAELERTLAGRITSLVNPIVGVGHSQVVLTAVIDHSQSTTTEELWDKDKAVVRSETLSDEKSTGPAQPAQGVAGAQGNLPGAPAPAPAANIPGASSQKTAQTRNYEINHIVKRIIGPKANLKTLHVAILVDHAKPDGAGKRLPRDPAVLKQIEALARSSVGLMNDRGDTIEVASAPFVSEEETTETGGITGTWPVWLKYVAMAAPAVLLVLVLALVLRSRRRRSVEEEEALPELPATVGELERTLPGPDSLESPAAALQSAAVRDRITQLVREDAARAAEVLQAWLLEGASKQEGEEREAKAS